MRYILCLDIDSAGIESEWRIRHHLKELEYCDVKFIRPKYKDWNEILKAQNGIEPLPAAPNPYLENMRSLLNEAMETISNTKPMLYPFKLFMPIIKGFCGRRQNYCWTMC